MKSTTKSVAVVLAVLLGVIALGWGIWALNVAMSPVRGTGDAYAQRNSAQNWTTAQARFEDLYAEVVATDRKITVAKERIDADPDDRTAKDTYFGTKSVCLSIVADYNADARKYLSESFRAADLPEQISAIDPTTDCKE
ncbi:MAG TPA: hypothetical protein VIP06_03550 [Nocardioides sp.]